jgi:hypothetical protein
VYWESWLFEPMSVYQFARLLAVHRAAFEGAPTTSFHGRAAPVLDGFIRQVFEALRAAAHSGERWFTRIGEPGIAVQPADSALSAVAAQMGEGRAVVVLPREAITWMGRNPNSRHLVPAAAAAVAVQVQEMAPPPPANTKAGALGAGMAGSPAQMARVLYPTGIRTNRAEEAQKACERWIFSQTAPPKNKGAAFEAALEACGNQLSHKAFERAWASKAPVEWKSPGRRRRTTT